MPSEIAAEIINRIFGDEKSKALDATKDALAGITYDLVQQRKLEFAKTMGFDLGDTAQDAADAVSDALPDNTPDEDETEVEASAEEETPETEEETTDETDQ
ncbi:hypothetical protein [Synechococcus phage S-B64]|uniref:Gp130 n=2 Tax=Shandvirus TaxID=2948904 RepID=A0A1Z1LWL5_9CAUD|nr:hypothetical protein KNT63_gp172 [Synechococcus phage S-H35]YP_010095268.1 hypothetical protein KNT88_gp030 [Synechococcus phage S-B64]ARW57052.1 hypothetical protein [Synechococcus phage S-H35]AWD90066.1 hypothetical protein [Synechococcus phage S-B64]